MATLNVDSENPRVSAVRGKETVGGGEQVVSTSGRSAFLRFLFAAVLVLTFVTGHKALASSLLFYNASTGEGATATLGEVGHYTFVGSIPGFARGWTHIVGN